MYKYWNKNKKPKIILQIVHGAMEYFDRYFEFKDYLLENDVMVVGDDLPSHGKNFDFEKNHHNFTKKEVIESVLKVSNWVKKNYPESKHIILGHSFGSFIVRYIHNNNLFKYNKIIISGTANPKTIMISLGIFYLSLIPKNIVSNQNNKLIFDKYGKRLKKNSYGKYWISSSEENLNKYNKDELCGKKFNNRSLSSLLIILNNIRKVHNLNFNKEKNIPFLFIWGKKDPVSNFGKEIIKLIKSMKKVGYSDIESFEYDSSKHEVLFDLEKDKVFNDLLKFILK